MGTKIDWTEVLSGSISIAPNIFGVGIDLSALTKAIKGASPDIEGKAEKAASALHEASVVVSELQGAIESEIEKVGALKKEYEKYKNLASISKEQSRSLLHQLEHYQNRDKSRERWIAWLINVAAGVVVFTLGVFVSPYIQGIIE